MIKLRSLQMVNGINPQGEPFITVTAQGSDNTLMLGQLSPDEVRAHAHALLACAEAAEQDAATLATLVDLLEDQEMAQHLAARIITTLRDRREGR